MAKGKHSEGQPDTAQRSVRDRSGVSVVSPPSGRNVSD